MLFRVQLHLSIANIFFSLFIIFFLLAVPFFIENGVMKNCSHGFPICNECFNKLPNNNGKFKCPYCNCKTDINKLYFMV